MSSAVLNAADAALSLRSDLSDVAAGQEGDLQGRRVTHWSYYAFIAGSVVGAIVAIAGFALVNSVGFMAYVVGAAGVLLAVTSGFAALYVKKFGILKTLDDYIRELAKRVQDFSSNILFLKSENQKLKQISKDLQEVPQDWREQIQKGKEAMQDKINELSKVAKKLQDTEAKLQKFAGVADDIQLQTKKLSESALEFSKGNDFLKQSVQKLEKHVTKLNEDNEDMAKQVMLFDAATDEFEAVSKRLGLQVKVFDDLFELMKKMDESAKERMAGLTQEVDDLQAAAKKIQEDAQQLDQSTKKYDDIIAQLEGQLVKFQKYAQYKIDYKALSKWVETYHDKEYQAWLKTNPGGGAA